MRFAFCVEQNVARFDVSMQNAVLMRVMNCAGQLGDQFRRMPDRHRLAPDYFVKLAAFDELHAEVAGAIALAHFVNRNDAWMVEAGRGFCFPAKALECASVAQWPRPITLSATVRLRLF